MRRVAERTCFIAAVLLIFVLITPLPSLHAAQDPGALQQSATKRMDRVTEYRRKTGDRTAFISELEQAQTELVSSIQGFTARQDLESALASMNKLADLQVMLRKWREAKEFYGQAYERARKANQRGNQVKALLGQSKIELYGPGPHDYQSTTRFLDEAIRLASDKKDLCEALEMKAEALTELREFNAALEVINRAYALAGEINDPFLLFYACFDRSSIYIKLANDCDTQSQAGFKVCYEALDRAKVDLDQADAVVRRAGYDFLLSPISISLKSVALRRQMVKNQEGFYSRIYGDKYKIFNPSKPQDVGVYESFISRDQSADDPDQAMLKRMLPEYIRKLEQEGENALSYSQRGLLQGMLGQDEAALQAHLKAVELLEADRRKLRDDRTRGKFLDDKTQVFYNAILYLLDRRRTGEAFELLERSRSRAMADLLQSQQLKFARPQDRAFYAASLKINADISLLQRQLIALRKSDAQQSAAKIAAAELQIQQLEQENLTLKADVTAAGSKLRELIVSTTASLQALQRSMREDSYETLYYLVLPTQVVLWHISSDAVNVRSVFLPREELVKKVASLRRSLVDGASTFDQKTSRELFLFLIQPALKWIKTDHLVVIPHEDLNDLPFQALKDWASDQYLGERFQISYAPSATILLRQKRAGSIGGSSLLAVADPGSSLEEAREEVQAVGRLYPGRSKVVFGVPVYEADIKSWVSGYELVHLSVHGSFVTAEPLLSHLILSKGGSDDGLLTAAEMFALPMDRAKLVVLSACETGKAEVTRANEILGMQRALLYAGANSLILSSWAVDAASTRLWMETFYREAQSKPLSEAARAAIVAVKKRPEYQHPYYWAPFLLIGR